MIYGTVEATSNAARGAMTGRSLHRKPSKIIREAPAYLRRPRSVSDSYLARAVRILIQLGSCLNLRLIQILLESREELPDLFGFSQVGHSGGDGIVVFESQEGR